MKWQKRLCFKEIKMSKSMQPTRMAQKTNKITWYRFYETGNFDALKFEFELIGVLRHMQRYFIIYRWRHRCAGGLKKKSDSQGHRPFVEFFNVPVLHRHGTTLFIRLFRETAQFSRLLWHAGDTEGVFST